MAAKEVGVFEVFRVGSTSREELASQEDLVSLRKKYSILSPIESLEQLRGENQNFELATVAPPTHMIVDKNSFASLMKQRIGEAIAEKEKEIRLIADDKVVHAAERIHKDRVLMASMFKAVFLAACSDLEEEVSKAVDPSVRETLSGPLGKHRAKILALLESEHFMEREQEQEQTDQDNQPSSAASSSSTE